MEIDLAHIMLLFVMIILLMGIMNKHFKGFLMQSTILSVVIYGVYFFVRGDYLSATAFLWIDMIFIGFILFNLTYYVLGHKLQVFNVKVPEDNIITQVARSTNSIYDISDDMKQGAEDIKGKFK